jgi:hypothetical protein
MADLVSTWKGRPLADMTKEELIEAMNELGEMYHRLLTGNLERKA